MGMNRLLTTALAVSLAAVTMQAQTRGGHAMGGRSFSGPRVSGPRVSGPHAGFGVGVRGAGVRGGFVSRGPRFDRGFAGPVFRGRSFEGRSFSGGISVRPGFRGHYRYPRPVRSYPYAYFGYYSPYAYYAPYGYSAYASGYYTPVYPYGLSYSYDDDTQQETITQYRQLNGEISDLNAEVRDLRDENAALREEAYGQKTTNRPTAKKEAETATALAPAPSAGSEKAEAPETSTVLVYKDGHKREVRSFAIVGKTLWILSELRAQKVPLADLDLDATEKANVERGIDFPMPVTK